MITQLRESPEKRFNMAWLIIVPLFLEAYNVVQIIALAYNLILLTEAIEPFAKWLE